MRRLCMQFFMVLLVPALMAGETPRLHLWQVDGSVASGIHVMFMGRKAMEKQLSVPGAADLTAYVLEQAYREMEDPFDDLGCELQFADLAFIPFDDYYTRDDMAFVRLRVPAGNEVQAVQLLGELLETARNADDEMIDRAVKGCTMANRMRRSTGQAAGMEIRNWLFPDTELVLPTYMTAPPSDMAAYRKFVLAFLSPENSLVTVAGSTGDPALQRTLADVFGTAPVSLPELDRTPAVDWDNPVKDSTAPGAQGYLLMLSPISDMGSDREQAAAVLWTSRISNRIAFQLREEEGLAYAIGAGITEIGGNRFLSIHMGTGPETVKRAARVIPELIGALRAEPITGDELDRLKNSVLIKRRMRRLMNINKAFFVGLDVLHGREPGQAERIDAALSAVTLDDMKQAMDSIGLQFLTLRVNADVKPKPERKMGMPGGMPPGMGR